MIFYVIITAAIVTVRWTLRQPPRTQLAILAGLIFLTIILKE